MYGYNSRPDHARGLQKNGGKSLKKVVTKPINREQTALTGRHQTSSEFPYVQRRNVEADFSGGDITGNAGITLLSRVDLQLRLTRVFATGDE